MATRSTIALEFADGTIGQVYCHWDGYLAHNGKILLENYSDPFKLQQLIDLGSLSSLRPEIGTKHPFDMYEANMTQGEYANLYRDMATFYGRDRGESNVQANYFKDIKDYNENVYGEEYDYILRNVDGKAQWYVRYHDTQGNWVRIEYAFEAEAVAEDN